MGWRNFFLSALWVPQICFQPHAPRIRRGRERCFIQQQSNILPMHQFGTFKLSLSSSCGIVCRVIKLYLFKMINTLDLRSPSLHHQHQKADQKQRRHLIQIAFDQTPFPCEYLFHKYHFIIEPWNAVQFSLSLFVIWMFLRLTHISV